MCFAGIWIGFGPLKTLPQPLGNSCSVDPRNPRLTQYFSQHYRLAILANKYGYVVVQYCYPIARDIKPEFCYRLIVLAEIHAGD